MSYDPAKYHRRSIRLKGYDYSQPGWYFVTIVTHNREMLFGNVVNGRIILNKIGRIADQCWRDIPDHFPNVRLDEYIIMPNHIHGIIIIQDTQNVRANDDSPHNTTTPQNVRANDDSPHNTATPQNVRANNDSPHNTTTPQNARANNDSPLQSPSKTIGSIIRGFKIGVTKWCRQNTDIYQVWQRNYYEHIIRNENDLNRIRNYIIENPLKWKEDKYFQPGGRIR